MVAARDIYFSDRPRGLRNYPSETRKRRSYDDRWRPNDSKLATLRDQGAEREGDLGWSLEYATAWCYKQLVGNQNEVVSAIDCVRALYGLDGVDKQTPFIVFDPLDRALFGGKLRGMVYMRWKSQVSNSPGTTSAPRVLDGIRRPCIELNKAPFEDGDGHIDDLLDALIHQMIHAFFLVACGAQPKSAQQDDRLLDGLHFGVIMYTIRDITRRCDGGMLDLIFHAAARAGCTDGRNDRRRFIALDPRSCGFGSPPVDGRSHCNHDNRSIRLAQIKNWQVEGYAVAIELGMESKGDVIYDLEGDSQFTEVNRLTGPASSSYVELVWGEKRVMVPREKALQYKSIKRPLEKNEKMELGIPDCEMPIFCQVYNYFTKGSTGCDERYSDNKAGRLNYSKGPPVIVGRSCRSKPARAGLIVHLQVFKIAEAMEFEELQQHIMQRLWAMPSTTDDPVDALKELYSDKDHSGPVHTEMHKWVRCFLARTGEEDDGDDQFGLGRRGGHRDMYRGLTNYHKLMYHHSDRFRELYHRNNALKDVCQLSMAQSMSDSGLIPPEYDPWYGVSESSPLMPNQYPTLTEGMYSGLQMPIRPRPHGLFDPLGLEGVSPLSFRRADRDRARFQDNMGLLGSRLPRQQLDWSDDRLPNGLNVSYKYWPFGSRDMLTEEKRIRTPRMFSEVFY
ncbi:hypothetical protein LTR08_000227 [Meristemomyces frigidus]|nr:hypothetical protein LTR08_000227 [Meristemomyces frigidus]